MFLEERCLLDFYHRSSMFLELLRLLQKKKLLKMMEIRLNFFFKKIYYFFNLISISGV